MSRALSTRKAQPVSEHLGDLAVEALGFALNVRVGAVEWKRHTRDNAAVLLPGRARCRAPEEAR